MLSKDWTHPSQRGTRGEETESRGSEEQGKKVPGQKHGRERERNHGEAVGRQFFGIRDSG